ncbi:hypothetical protein EN817_23650 [Mesorhizobium sp. M3A.F.Ca.ET.174.01.1.1]|uniref:hypothetical protein n=1 Tax=unclassified Mesorhizobium TaxID=325217 RepID=UPI0010934A01|nr:MULTISPECIES: hypothetical protein [unclassified Mesorhizobium]TGS85094.1 hypothetical protein EN818_21735 [Mesorhizobium sp. M3A.F.Ca.ET.175.01.1.1]TGT23082.1 hypothetical protein EN817_23650 [Mesorhizobium sp. M3A.F.Ca.ET.174.01.1.1]
MSGVVVPFVGRPEKTARENLAGFIEHARALPFFSGENALPWDALTWDLRERSKSRGNRSLVLHFVDFDSAGRGAGKTGAVAIGKPFLETAKALVANAILSGQVSRPYRWLLALRAVDKAFREIGDEADLVALTPAVLDKAVSLIRAEHDDKNGLASSLEQIAGFAAAKHLTSVHLAWKSSAPTVRDQRRSIQVREDGSSNVIEKLPHLKCVLDLASVFLGAETGADAVTTAWFALAMFAPSRVSEILALPVGCETEMGGVYGISWRPSKGGEPLTKFATTLEWADVARTAIRRLKAIGEPARRAAAWYARNPGKLYLPPGYEHLRDQPLTQPEVYAILGVQGEFNNYALSRIIEPTEHCTTDPARTGGRGWTRLYDFGSLQTYVVEHLPLGFPYADRKFDLMAEDALFCGPRHTMRGNVAVQANVPDLIDPGRIYKDLNHPSSTVFRPARPAQPGNRTAVDADQPSAAAPAEYAGTVQASVAGADRVLVRAETGRPEQLVRPHPARGLHRALCGDGRRRTPGGEGDGSFGRQGRGPRRQGDDLRRGRAPPRGGVGHIHPVRPLPAQLLAHTVPQRQELHRLRRELLHQGRREAPLRDPRAAGRQ